MNSRLILMMILLSVSALACGGEGGKKGGWDLGNDGGSGNDSGGDGGTVDGGDNDGGTADQGQDTGETDAGVVPEPVTFRLVNASGGPVFAYQSVVGGAACHPGGWLEVIQQGQSQRVTSDCSRCSCDEPDCATCAFDCAPGVDPDYAQLSHLEARTFEWDGLLRVDQQQANGATCEAFEAPTAETLTARFCWAHDFEANFEPWGLLTEIECADVEFSPTDTLVEHRIEPAAFDAVQFRLRNETGDTLFAQPTADGYCSMGSWILLSQDGQPLRISSMCGNCRCTEVGDASACPQPCPGAPCALPSAEQFELRPGEERVHWWSRVAFHDDEVDGMMCEWDRLVTGLVTAEMCWGTAVAGEFDPVITGSECVTIEFDPFADEIVEHVITAP